MSLDVAVFGWMVALGLFSNARGVDRMLRTFFGIQAVYREVLLVK